MNHARQMERWNRSLENRAVLHQGISNNISLQQDTRGFGIPAVYGNMALQQQQVQDNFGWTPKRRSGLGIVRQRPPGQLSDAFNGSNMNLASADLAAARLSNTALGLILTAGGAAGYWMGSTTVEGMGHGKKAQIGAGLFCGAIFGMAALEGSIRYVYRS